MQQRRILIFVSAILVAASLAFWSGTQMKVHAEGEQPHMEAALHHLHEAQEELRLADDNKGGHRGNAMKLVEQAIGEVDAGIHYADRHDRH